MHRKINFNSYETRTDTIRYRRKEFDEDFCTFAQNRIQEQVKKIEHRYRGDCLFLENLDYNVDEIKSLLGVIQKITGYHCGISLKQLKFNLSANRIIVEESDCQSQRYQHSPIKGACHYHPYVPIIILDGGDLEKGKIFTLIYFLVALLVEHQFVGKKIGKEKFNRFSSDFWCNMVAGEFLIPKDEFDCQWEIHQEVEVEEIFWELAEFFQVSKSAIIVKARFTHKISQEAYEEYYKKYDLAQFTCSSLLAKPQGKKIYDDEEIFNQEKSKLYFLLGKVLLENFKSTKSLKICQKVQGLIEEIFKPTYQEMQKVQG
ncbi:ImmA/IrrE family metallo-endopeptidase [Helicobacter brantae]|uniref:Uncharacterized protein n=1 Tax=Helicobacter brantae TaxID=375927 RepID=A0A3D8J2B8_9HELI|nr:ImmA/IrrE family metallo-endopeptidase [Helicobacter brantae]RDU71692.1 hypothetical protein CQA58_01250 [Helicobacter brantae]